MGKHFNNGHSDMMTFFPPNIGLIIIGAYSYCASLSIIKSGLANWTIATFAKACTESWPSLRELATAHLNEPGLVLACYTHLYYSVSLIHY